MSLLNFPASLRDLKCFVPLLCQHNYSGYDCFLNSGGKNLRSRSEARNLSNDMFDVGNLKLSKIEVPSFVIISSTIVEIDAHF